MGHRCCLIFVRVLSCPILHIFRLCIRVVDLVVSQPSSLVASPAMSHPVNHRDNRLDNRLLFPVVNRVNNLLGSRVVSHLVNLQDSLANNLQDSLLAIPLLNRVANLQDSPVVNRLLSLVGGQLCVNHSMSLIPTLLFKTTNLVCFLLVKTILLLHQCVVIQLEATAVKTRTCV